MMVAKLAVLSRRCRSARGRELGQLDYPFNLCPPGSRGSAKSLKGDAGLGGMSVVSR
jgi:hypothetical protein